MIIIGQLNGTPQSIVRGVAGTVPVPYKGTEATPNVASAPDTADDVRGGIELEGIVHINKFVHDGGLLVLSPGAAGSLRLTV